MSTDCKGCGRTMYSRWREPTRVFPGIPCRNSKKKANRRPKTSVESKEEKKPSRHRGAGKSQLRGFQQPNAKSFKPMRITTRETPRAGGQVTVVRGQDLVRTIGTSSSAYSAGDVLLDFKLNPELSAIPRLTAMAKLYRKYRIVSASFTYEPTATIAPGALLGYVDYEPYQGADVGTGEQRLQRATASYGEQEVNITNRRTWKVDPMKLALYIHSDLASTWTHWDTYAKFILYASSVIAANTPCGRVVFHYEVEFSYPTYEDVSLSAEWLLGAGGVAVYSSEDGKEKFKSLTRFPGSNEDIYVTLDANYPQVIHFQLPYYPDSTNNYWMLYAYPDVVNSSVWINRGAMDGLAIDTEVQSRSTGADYTTGIKAVTVEVTAKVNFIQLVLNSIEYDCNVRYFISRIPWLEVSSRKARPKLCDVPTAPPSTPTNAVAIRAMSTSSSSSSSSSSTTSGSTGSTKILTNWVRV